MVTISRAFALIVIVAYVLLGAVPQKSDSRAVPDPIRTIILGVLEDVPGHYVGQASSRAVRVVFYKDGSRWRSFPSDCSVPSCLKSVVSKYPPSVDWTITFDGQNLGRVKSYAPKEFETYGDIGLQAVARGENVPIIGKRTTEFGGYGGDAVYRPLITNSQPNYKDPEMWRPSELSSGLITALRKKVGTMFPPGSRCDQGDPTDKRVLTYAIEDLKLAKAYSSKNGWAVAQIRLDRYLCSGDSEHDFADQWFVIAPEGGIKFLGESLRFVDAGDYDNEGKSDLVFSIDGDNRGGYELYYDNFTKRAVFEFSYH